MVHIQQSQYKNFEKLRQLLLIEEFKKCFPDEMKNYLDEEILR